MMIDVTVADVDADIAALYTHMNPLVAGADLTRHAPTRLVFTTTSHDRFIITGTDLHWDGGAVTSGAVDALIFRSHKVDLITFANLQTTGAGLWAAMQAEQDGTDPAALTHLLAHHCWTYHGSEGADYFPETTLEPFGALNLTGNDKVWLNGGDDVFFTGDAKDTVYGGAGDDQIAGGTDNDLLIGGAGNDALYGGEGQDRLEGGPGDDTLSGGDGADVFVFGSQHSADVITDYAVGLDHVQITGSITLTVQGDDTLITFGSGSVLLLGVDASLLGPGDFL